MKVSSITGIGVISFLGIALSGLIVFSYLDTSAFINNSPLLSGALGVQTASADLAMQEIQPARDEPLPVWEKHIYVSLQDQTLTYVEGMYIVGQFKISSGVRGKETPPGEYTVLAKKPLVNYKGPGYDFPNTKWNLMFKPGTPKDPLNYYIHGAPWNHNFGHPMSHGCINVSYANMEGLYNWADVGTKITIQ